MNADADGGAPATADGAGLDRRTLLRRVGLGAAVAGAGWVAPQVLIASPAWAGCSPIFHYLQIDACNCESIDRTVFDTFASPPGNEPTCVPSGWTSGTEDPDLPVFSCAGDPCYSGQVTIVGPCFPVEAKATILCQNASGNQWSCVTGSINGQTISFGALDPFDPLDCIYWNFRIKIACCT